MSEFFETLLDAFIDSVKILPILLVVYFFIEFLEYKNALKFEKSKLLKGKASPVIGALFGCVPQCGFSVVTTDLYTKRAVSIGALVAVYLATSDEALPIMLAEPNHILDLLLLIGCKLLLGIVVGYLSMFLYSKLFKNQNGSENVENKTNFALKQNKKANEKALNSSSITVADNLDDGFDNVGGKTDESQSKAENDKLGLVLESETDLKKAQNHTSNKEGEKVDESVLSLKNNEKSEIQTEEHSGCCHHSVNTKKFEWIHPLIHCLKIFAYILIVNVVLGIAIFFIGEENFLNFLQSSFVFQPLLSVVIGLIPNCAASVLITELYLAGGLSFGSVLAGLCVNSGIAIILLLKQNKNWKENLFIFAMLIVPSLLVGYALHFIPIF